MRSCSLLLGVVMVALLGGGCLGETDAPNGDITSEGTEVELAPDPRDLSVRYARGTVVPSEVSEPIDEERSAAEAASLRHQIADGVANIGTNDGQVYNVTTTVNVRQCASTSCAVLRVAYTGADLENDASGGKYCSTAYPYYCWIRVVYAYGSGNACDTTQYKGWVIVDPLSAGNPYVLSGPLNVRQSPCNGSIITSVPAGTTLTFFQGNNQWSNKWYEVHVPGNFFQAGWIDGWDFADVR